MGKTIIYQLLPRLWGNRKEKLTFNGYYKDNGSGKFSDIDSETLEYLKWAGVSHLWLTGVIRHSCSDSSAMGSLKEGDGGHVSSAQFVKGNAGSPYAIQDWYDVNPYLADKPAERMDEFEKTIERIHKAGLKVLIDFIPNHVARDYGAGVDLSIKGRATDRMSLGAGDDVSQHWKAENDFFYYPGQRLQLPNESQWKADGKTLYEEYPAKASGNAYTPNPGMNDWYETVKLNYCDFHTATWDKMLHVLKYWMGKGVDGFRCDMVELVPAAFMKWAIEEVRKDWPDAFFVAEVYQKSLYQKYIREIGFDLLYDKSGMYDALSDIVRNDDNDYLESWQCATRITSVWQDLGDLQMYMLNFLENHDEQRFASEFFGKKAEKCFPALAVSLLMNQAAFMNYFGEETGEPAAVSEGFSGRDGRTTIFDWWNPEKVRSLWKLTRNGNYAKAAELFSLKNSDSRRGVLRTKVKNAVQLKMIMQETGLNEQELRFFVKYTSLLRFAACDNAISSGMMYDLCYCNYDSEGFDKNRHFVFLRDDHEDTFLIAANFSSAAARMKIHIPERAFEWLELEQTPQCNAGKPVCLEVPADDLIVLRLSSSLTPHPQVQKHNFGIGE